MGRKIAVADCETDPFKRGRTDIRPFIWGYYDGDDYQEFYSTKEFVEYVVTKPIILYAHNGGKFDWFFILEYLPDWSKIMVIDGRLSKFKIGECEFRDSYNILPTPLSAYKKDEVDYAIFEAGERDKPHNKKIISAYLKSDCVYTYELVYGFIKKYGLSLTLAGAAMKQWHKISGIPPAKTAPSLYTDLSPFYHGGRVECFQHGIFETPLKMIDIHSAYPFAMNSLHPYGDSYHVGDVLPETEAYIARCFIEIECASFGAFPYRDKRGLSFPNDSTRRVYCVTGHEYLAALRTKTISPDYKILKVIQFSDSITFRDYVKKFYSEKESAEKGSKEYIYAKLFLNTLYGKYGANPAEYSEYEVVPAEYILECINDGWSMETYIPGQKAIVSQPLPEERQRFFNVAVAASITGYVRAYLWESIKQTTMPLYCDTDSIICQEPGRLYLDEKEIGAWDIEIEGDYCAIAGKKLYYIEGSGKYTGKHKQASKGARLTPGEIIKVAQGEAVLYSPVAPSFSLINGTRILERKIKITV